VEWSGERNVGIGVGRGTEYGRDVDREERVG